MLVDPVPLGGLNPADPPLIDAEILFRQAGPALFRGLLVRLLLSIHDALQGAISPE